MITAATSIVITKPTIRPVSLFGSFERTPSFVVSSLTDAAVVTFTVDEVILVDVTGIVAAVVFGSLPIVVATAVVAVCEDRCLTRSLVIMIFQRKVMSMHP